MACAWHVHGTCVACAWRVHGMCMCTCMHRPILGDAGLLGRSAARAAARGPEAAGGGADLLRRGRPVDAAGARACTRALPQRAQRGGSAWGRPLPARRGARARQPDDCRLRAQLERRGQGGRLM
eukprot:scaffold67699_cov63-Phaeocystis_antarctica.AAC.4